MTIYYCPRGCQQCDAHFLFDLECGNCGSRMTTDSTSYDAFWAQREEDQILAFEARERGITVAERRRQIEEEEDSSDS
jgi:hypothetical protein